MKYYCVEMQTRFPDEGKVLGLASAKFVPDKKKYLEKMWEDAIIKDAPVFDYFYLESWTSRGGKNEWRLQDVHRGGTGYPGSYWYISDKCKKLLEEFYIAPEFHFYPTKLLYKKEKLDYWIFQFPVKPFQNYNLEKSVFYHETDNNEKKILPITTEKDYYKMNTPIPYCPKLVLKDSYDIVNSLGDTENFNSFHIIISEELKNRMEQELKGFLFHEIDYQVEIDN